MQGRYRAVAVIVVGLFFALAPLSHADLFDDAVSALTNDNLDAATLDHLGQALKGGLVAGYPQYTPGPTPLHGFDISTPCGSFSFGQGFIDNLAGMLDPTALIAGIQQTAMNLIGAAISQLPMIGLCYATPTICDLVKYLQSLINEVLQFKGLSCQQSEQLLAGLGAKFSGARTARCISKEQRAGKTLVAAEAACARASSPGIIDPETGNEVPAGGKANLIAGSMKRAGASQELLDFAKALLGEVSLKAGGSGLDVDIEAPSKRVHDEYQQERNDLHAKISDAVNIVGVGNPLTSAKHRDVSLPGLSMPHGALRALYNISLESPAAYEQYAHKLAGAMTLLKMSWKIGETRDLLEEGMLDNPEMDEPGMEVIRTRLARLERERERFVSEKELADRHVLPVLESIFDDNRNLQKRATRAGLLAGLDTGTAANRFGAQNPMGYGY
jgi:hypothetical protein